MPDRREEAALLPKGAAVGHDSEGVHLQGIVVVEAQRLMPDDPRIERVVSRLQPLGALSSNLFLAPARFFGTFICDLYRCGLLHPFLSFSELCFHDWDIIVFYGTHLPEIYHFHISGR